MVGLKKQCLSPGRRRDRGGEVGFCGRGFVPCVLSQNPDVSRDSVSDGFKGGTASPVPSLGGSLPKFRDPGAQGKEPR